MATRNESRISTYRFCSVFQVQFGLSIYDSIHFVFTSNLKTNSEEDPKKLSLQTYMYTHACTYTKKYVNVVIHGKNILNYPEKGIF